MTKLEKASLAVAPNTTPTSIVIRAIWLEGARWALEQMTSEAAVNLAMRAAFETEHRLGGREEQMTAALAAARKRIDR